MLQVEGVFFPITRIPITMVVNHILDGMILQVGTLPETNILAPENQWLLTTC